MNYISRFIKYISINIFLLFANCTGTYYGIDGPDVIEREEAVAKINTALFLKSAACGFNEKNTLLLLNNYSVSPRKVLDGKYYSTKDIDACVNNINLGSCESYLIPCRISPKGFLDGGGIFQGGF
jgi:small lipoprotein (TIGR04452 family)